MLLLIIFILVLFSFVLNYYLFKEYYKLKEKYESKIDNIDLNLKTEIDQKRFYRKFSDSLLRELERVRFINQNMKKIIIENRSLIKKFKK
jgi:predicted Holliday junction resolvase-like endonuclease